MEPDEASTEVVATEDQRQRLLRRISRLRDAFRDGPPVLARPGDDEAAGSGSFDSWDAHSDWSDSH